MAYYEYHCAKCDHTFEVKQSFEEHDRHVEVRCPQCQSKDVHSLLTAAHAHTTKKS